MGQNKSRDKFRALGESRPERSSDIDAAKIPAILTVTIAEIGDRPVYCIRSDGKYFWLHGQGVFQQMPEDKLLKYINSNVKGIAQKAIKFTKTRQLAEDIFDENLPPEIVRIIFEYEPVRRKINYKTSCSLSDTFDLVVRLSNTPRNWRAI